MIRLNFRPDLVLFAVLIVVLLVYLALRRYLAMRRIKEWNAGTVPDTFDLGVVFNGYSTDDGMLKPVKGAMLATKNSLIFVSTEIKRMSVELPWSRLAGWRVIREFRGRPLHRAMVAFRLDSEVGEPVELAFALPRAEFWTKLVDIAIKSDKKE